MKEALKTLADVAQGMSNAAASTVSAPVDLIAWLLKKGGLDVGKPAMGSDWMAERGLTRQPTNALAGYVGEGLGAAAPSVLAAKAPQVANALVRMGDNALSPRTLNPQQGAIVWHGSPHKFDRFDSSKIGTGEGAQAYGHGLYLAELPDVAATYSLLKAKSQMGDFTLRDFAANGFDMAQMKRNLHAKYPFARKEYFADKDLADIVGGDKRIELVRALQDLRAASLYKVDLPDTAIAKMLDWDKPLSQQAFGVPRSLLNEVGSHRWNLSNMPADPTGQQLVQAMQRMQMQGAESSRRLQQVGIPGIRYLDGGSRGAGSGTSNFVVFPGEEGLLTILERNGAPIR